MDAWHTRRNGAKLTSNSSRTVRFRVKRLLLWMPAMQEQHDDLLCLAKRAARSMDAGFTRCQQGRQGKAKARETP
jgi:hypothetical protein